MAMRTMAATFLRNKSFHLWPKLGCPVTERNSTHREYAASKSPTPYVSQSMCHYGISKPMDKDHTIQASIVERTKADFDPKAMLEARRKSWEALNRIAAFIHANRTRGITEKEATEYGDTILSEMGCQRKWHRTWIRFGVNTTLTYGNLSVPDTKLRENDIFFLDMGPVFDGFEGDVGAPFTVGNDPDMIRCARDAKFIFDEVHAKWKNDRLSGKELYLYAEKRARELGWVLNFENSNGHRLSDFPHTLYYKGSVQGLPFVPKPFVWVLEIQIRHPEKPFGAFYEDLMVDS